MTFPTISAGTRANEAIGGYANFIAYANALAAGVDSVTTTAAGAALKANNLSDLASASTARTNLGLGTAAVANTGTGAGTVAAGDDSRIVGAAQKAANLTDLTDAALARAALGLGSASQSATTDFDAAGSAATAQSAAQSYAAALVDDLSGVTDAVAARAALGLGTMATEAASAYALLAGAAFTGPSSFSTNATGTTPLTVNAYAASTVDTFTVRNSGGAKIGGWDEWGQLNTQYLTDITGASPYLRLQTNSLFAINQGNAANNAFAIRGMAAQAGHLLLCETSSSIPVASISAAGKGLFTNVGPTSGNLNLVDSANDIGVQICTSDVTIPKRIISSASGTSALTMSGQIVAAASTTAASTLRIPHGSAPSSPVDGDMWTTTAGLFVRINGATVGPLS